MELYMALIIKVYLNLIVVYIISWPMLKAKPQWNMLSTTIGLCSCGAKLLLARFVEVIRHAFRKPVIVQFFLFGCTASILVYLVVSFLGGCPRCIWHSPILLALFNYIDYFTHPILFVLGGMVLCCRWSGNNNTDERSKKYTTASSSDIWCVAWLQLKTGNSIQRIVFPPLAHLSQRSSLTLFTILF
jgi:hypothetical protein